MPSGEVDVVVVGGGPAGEVCAARLAGEGLAVALVEQELVGGECAFWACMPSKALLRPGELLTELARVPGAREAASAPLDVAAVLRRRDEVVGGFDDTHHAERLEQRGVEIVRGSARLAGERCVRVGKEELRARRAVILAPGSAPLVPPIPGLEDVRAWSDREGTTAGKVPARLVIVGGGVVGAELAGAWRSLGAEVVLLEAAPSLLLREEPFAGEQVAACLEERGVEVRCGVQVSEVSRPEAGALRVGLADGAVVEGDELLVAVGRRPRTEELGLETVGLSPGEAIPVDDAMRAGARSWLYAVGDVNERALLTHAGKYQAWAACEQILGRDARASWDGPLSPRVCFTEPQVAAAGHTLKGAREAGLDAVAVDQALGAVAAASFVGRGAGGTARLVLDRGRRVLVGATFTGPEVAELLHAATIAIVGEVPVERLRHAIPSFPTRSEVWLRLQDKLEAALCKEPV